MKQLIVITISILMMPIFSLAQLSKTKIPDNANIYILAPKNTGEAAKEGLEKKHNWHIVNDRSQAQYVVKFNMHKLGYHRYATADIYKGSDIVGSTGSVRGGAFASRKRVIDKLIRKRF